MKYVSDTRTKTEAELAAQNEERGWRLKFDSIVMGDKFLDKLMGDLWTVTKISVYLTPDGQPTAKIEMYNGKKFRSVGFPSASNVMEMSNWKRLT